MKRLTPLGILVVVCSVFGLALCARLALGEEFIYLHPGESVFVPIMVSVDGVTATPFETSARYSSFADASVWCTQRTLVGEKRQFETRPDYDDPRGQGCWITAHADAPTGLYRLWAEVYYLAHIVPPWGNPDNPAQDFWYQAGEQTYVYIIGANATAWPAIRLVRP